MSHVILGPPGTGKTEAGALLAREFGNRTRNRPGGVAYLSFTKAAAWAAATRIADADMTDEEFKERFPLFRTIHSLAYMGIRRARPDVRVAKPSDLKKFSVDTGYEIATEATGDDLDDVYRAVDPRWDAAYRAYMLSRIHSLGPAAADAARTEMAQQAIETIGFIGRETYQAFVSRYEGWKEKESLIDFMDMIEYAFTDMPPVEDCPYVIVDEAQDLSACLHAVVNRLFPDSEVWWIGDEDQSIHEWSGALPSLFLDRIEESRSLTILRQTHRFGPVIAGFAERVISRVPKRITKDVLPKDGQPGSIQFTGSFEPAAREMLVLHRHVDGCRIVAADFIARGLPFTNERGRNPLGASSQLKAWKALDLLAKGEALGLGQVRSAVEALPSRGELTAVVFGAKKRVESKGLIRPMTLDLLVKDKVLTEEGAREVRRRNWAAAKQEYRDNFAYYERVTANGHALDPAKAPIITTIHGAKGRQAPEVVVFDECSPRCHEKPDAEHRLAYVAATRTQRSLTICSERKLEWASARYDYPKNSC